MADQSQKPKQSSTQTQPKVLAQPTQPKTPAAAPDKTVSAPKFVMLANCKESVKGKR